MIGKSILLLAGAASAFGIGTNLATAPSVAAPAAADVHMHDEGNDGMFSLDVTPREDSREVDVVIVNELPRRAWASLAVEIVDDRGATVAPAHKLKPFAVDARGAGPDIAHALPHKLADGYYVVRVTGALSDGERSETKTITQHYQVTAGRAVAISPNDFYKESAAAIAVPLAEVTR